MLVEGILGDLSAMAPPSSMGTAGSPSAGAPNGNARANNSKTSATTPASTAPFPPPKTDKPRPHICGTCSRSFARLEHLKRHERSHTKEKPFECPECTRCFARRDLLLRHQQKLHLTATPARPRNRRESTNSMAGSGPGRIRKNSVANSGMPGVNGPMMTRPRANTISHIDGTTLGMIAAANASAVRSGIMAGNHSHHPSLAGLPGTLGFDFRGMSTGLGQIGHHGLPKLDTNGLSSLDVGGGLRTAPPYATFQPDYDIDGFFFGGPGSTINPAQLHFNDSPQSVALGTPTSPYHQAFPGLSNSQVFMEDEDSLEWISGFESHMSFHGNTEHAVGESSPSVISTASQGGISEIMLDGSNNPAVNPGPAWAQAPMMQQSQVLPSNFSMDMSRPPFSDMVSPPATMSPQSFLGQRKSSETSFATPPLPPTISGMTSQYFHPPMVFHPDMLNFAHAPRKDSGPIDSPTTFISSISEPLRQTILHNLSQPHQMGHLHRKQSVSSNPPPSPNPGLDFARICASFPSTGDLQRYASAYVQYFHPHLPFLHIPTLSFDPQIYSGNVLYPEHIDGGCCLLLAMTALGALYELEPTQSKDLFESSKKMTQVYLEERRNADLSQSIHSSGQVTEDTPLWLVQVTLLNVVYGINCGDKVSGDVANTHCAALVSLARAADLARPLMPDSLSRSQNLFPTDLFNHRAGSEDIQMGDDALSGSGSWQMAMSNELSDQQSKWLGWKDAEERKRTLYAVFILSSLLVAAYNRAPALMNAEMRLDLPCEEDLWTADSAQAWNSLLGTSPDAQRSTPFTTALGILLSSSQRQPPRHQVILAYGNMPEVNLDIEALPEMDLQPSTFGCLVLINALHNYIWETRQRQSLGQPSMQEKGALHTHLEPALKAWETAWCRHPYHSLERPNPFGRSSLSADCTPLLDLAYVRLFVDFGQAKEAFWQRDYDLMADELAKGGQNAQPADTSPSSGSSASDPADSLTSAVSATASPSTPSSSPDLTAIKTPTPHHAVPTIPVEQQREPEASGKHVQHLRNAAGYALEALSRSNKLGVTFADFTSRELPLQAAACAMDCAQVIAEWVTTLQEHVGPHLGVLGRDNVDYGQVPAIMLLDTDDMKLLEQVAEVLAGLEAKLAYGAPNLGGPSAAGVESEYSNILSEGGYASRLLRVTAQTLSRNAIWPVTRLMAQALETQAVHVENRAARSIQRRT